MITNALDLVHAAAEPEPKLDNTRPRPVMEYLHSRLRGRLEDDILYVSDFVSIYVQHPERRTDGCDVYVRVFGYAVWGVLDWNETKLIQLVHVLSRVNRIVYAAAAYPDPNVEHFQTRIGMELNEHVLGQPGNQLYSISGFAPHPYHKFWSGTKPSLNRYTQWFQRVLTKLQHRPATAAAEPAPVATWNDVLDLLRQRPNHQYPVRMHNFDIAVRVFNQSPVIFVEPNLHPTSKVHRYVRLMINNGSVLIDASADTLSAHTPAVPLNSPFYRINVYELFRKFPTAKAALSHLLQQIPERVLHWLWKEHVKAEAASEPLAPLTWADVVAFVEKHPRNRCSVKIHGVDCVARVIPNWSPNIYVEHQSNSHDNVLSGLAIIPMPNRGHIVMTTSPNYIVSFYDLFRQYPTAKTALAHLLQQIPAKAARELAKPVRAEAASEPEITRSPSNLLAQLFRMVSSRPLTVTVDGVPVHFAAKAKRQSPRISYGDTEDYRIISTDGSTKYSILLPLHNIPVPYVANERPLQLMQRLAEHMVRWYRK